MWNEILEQPQVLNKCMEANRQVIIDLAKTIKDRNVDFACFAARGSSDHAGIYGKYIFEILLGMPVAMAAPSVFTIYERELNLTNKLVVGISQSGKAEDVLEVLKKTKQCGAITVSITNDCSSPLALLSDFHLYCNAGIEKSVAATKTFSSQMFILALLATEISKNTELKKELHSISENINKIFEISDSMSLKVERYRFMEECFILSRGVNYSVAMEAALKIQETSYVRARAYATSDFHHGPFAMVQKDTAVIVFAPQGPSLENNKEMIRKIKKMEGEVITVSNDKDTLKMGNNSFEIPQTKNDIISPFYNVITSQMFACKLSLTKGLNPDTPRGLNKITITK
jgi:glucosamine--fructose-6-phosphate aminotransferase (isomerizing)